MATIFIVWCEDPVVKKSVVLGYNKNRKQAEEMMIKAWGQKATIEERTIKPEDIRAIREVNLNVCQYTLDNIKSVGESVLKDKTQILLLRADLLERIKNAEQRLKMPEYLIFSDEIEMYIKGLEADVFL
jgi:hypothetical protein